MADLLPVDGDDLRRRIVEAADDGRWRVRVPGSTRASGICATIEEAEWLAGQILVRSGGGIVDVRDPARGDRQFAVTPRKPVGKLYRKPRGARH